MFALIKHFEIVIWYIWHGTVYPKKYAHGFCFAVLCCGYTWTDFPISIRLTSLALWQSNDCPSASKATLMNMDKYFMWIYYERLHNHNNKTVCIFLGIYCICRWYMIWHNQTWHDLIRYDMRCDDSIMSHLMAFGKSIWFGLSRRPYEPCATSWIIALYRLGANHGIV